MSKTEYHYHSILIAWILGTDLETRLNIADCLIKKLQIGLAFAKRAIDSYVGSRGCIPSADIAVKIAKVLGTSVEYLVTGEAPSVQIVVPENSALKHINSYKSKAERKLIKNFINLSEKDKDTVIALAEYLYRSSKKSV